ncbi:hypothetical protein Nepgr_000009 [Nepenthes gracilis]|uniref:EngB-type G domain-containing protein n=1 Tax=Nepenthes gracilis TaxID=150966 RepID=A0AAD3P1E2_NEPGR|nr:hypothetical protein Nepgr_000009 [Nepenthes gracilis]
MKNISPRKRRNHGVDLKFELRVSNLDRRRKRISAGHNLDAEPAKLFKVRSKIKSKATGDKVKSEIMPQNRAKSKVGSSKQLKTKFKIADSMAVVGEKNSESEMQNKIRRKRTQLDSTTISKQSKGRQSIRASLKSTNKKTADKKNLMCYSEGAMDFKKPKRRKRAIRIDPHDISNKRLDDGIILDNETKVEDSEQVELSRNAQFRAIRPSPSILAFVEENLLGQRRLIELRRAGYNIDLSAPLDNIPLSTGSDRARIEESIFRNKLAFFAAAKVSSSFPPPDLPEIAFAGRSNVGKSSLLSALTRQWGIVRTSDKPGLTQSINFFKLGSKLCLVDLPGYGFAYAKEEVKDAWEELVKEYVSSRVGLKRVCILIDTKWGIKPRDHELIYLMERSQTKYQIVLTKTDMVLPADVARRAMQIEEALKANRSIVQPVMMVSSKSGAGIRSLRTVLAKIARFARP